jgi:ABC-type nickel/cobalt efflux system permease component RcnA
MGEGMLARMVARAIPPHITDADQQRIAAEAAENAIRQTAWFAGIAGVLLLVLAGTMLYRYLPVQQNRQVRSEPSKAANEVAADESKLHQTDEDVQQKLEDVTKELQGKVSTLEGQVAELTTKLRAAQKSTAGEERQANAAKETPESLRQVAGFGRAGVATRPPSVYQCGDGRTARDPSQCRDTASPAASEVRAAPTGVYQCGDGRTTHNPAECKATASPLDPRG